MKQKLKLTAVLLLSSTFLFAQQLKKTDTVTVISDSLKNPALPTTQAKGWDGKANDDRGSVPVKPGSLNPGETTTPPLATHTTHGKVTAQTKKSLIPLCNFRKNVTGYNALCKELNTVRNCDVAICPGIYTTQSKTQFLLTNSSGSIITYMSNQLITVTEQNNAIAIANNWAVANTPAGFTIRYIKFIPDVVVGSGITSAGIDIVVTYQHCTAPKKIND